MKERLYIVERDHRHVVLISGGIATRQRRVLESYAFLHIVCMTTMGNEFVPRTLHVWPLDGCACGVVELWISACCGGGDVWASEVEPWALVSRRCSLAIGAASAAAA